MWITEFHPSTGISKWYGQHGTATIMANHQDLEDLHQKAAAHYLQGDFPTALTFWRDLLELDPADERAQEGIRLCELLAAEDGADGATAEIVLSDDSAATAEPAQVGTATTGPEAGAVSAAPGDAFDAEDLGHLDDLLGLDDGPDAAALSDQASLARSADAPPARDVAEALDGDPSFDLGADIDAVFDAPFPPEEGGAQRPVQTDGDHGFDLEDMPELESPTEGDRVAAGEPPQADAAGSRSAAAEELQRRVNELIHEATAAYDAGDPDTALGVLARVAILDDLNPHAMRLRQVIESDRADSPAEAAPSLDGGPALFEAPEDLEAAALATPADARPDEASAGSWDAQAAEEEADAEAESQHSGFENEQVGTGFDGGTADLDQAAEPAPEVDSAAGESARKRSGSKLVKPLLAAGLAVVLLGGGFVAWKLLAGGASDPALDDALREAKAVEAKRAEETAPGSEPAAAQPEDTVSSEQIGAMLAQGQAAYDSGEYAVAVVVAGKILEQVPDHAAAAQLLTLAGERYHAQRDHEAKLEQVRRSFDDGNYHEALRVLYRLPGADGDPRFNRLKANGWINLALRSLIAGNCTDARERLDEAQALQPDMAGLERLGQFITACPNARYDPGFLEEAAQLPLRGLED